MRARNSGSLGCCDLCGDCLLVNSYSLSPASAIALESSIIPRMTPSEPSTAVGAQLILPTALARTYAALAQVPAA